MTLNIAIAGAGIGGLTAALRLAREGHTVTVFEKYPALTPTGAGIVVSANARAHLDALGLGDEVESWGQPLSEMCITTASGRMLSTSPGTIHLDGRALTAVAIHRASLSELLLKACRKLGGINICFGQAIVAFESSPKVQGDDQLRVVVRESPEKVSRLSGFDVLVGADGLHSALRAQLHPGEPFRYSGYRCFRGVARTQLNSEGRAFEAWGRGLRLGMVPLGESGTYWFAVENAAPGCPVPAGSVKSHLLDTFAEFPPFCVELLEQTKPGDILQHDLYDRRPVERWGNGRVTLLGDAAHPMTPNLGQGAAQSIEDATFLAHFLSDPHYASRPQDALRAYEQARLPRTTQVVNQSFTLGRIAQSQGAVSCWLRDCLLWLVPQSVTNAQLTRLVTDGRLPMSLGSAANL